MIRWFGIAAWVLAAGCAVQKPMQADPNRASVDAPRSYFVVTVRNTRAGGMRAGSTARDYDFAPLYGPSPRAQSDVLAIGRRYGLKLVDAWPIEVLDVHCVVFAAQTQSDPAELLSRLKQDARVESAQPLNSFTTLAAREKEDAARRAGPYTDPYFELQQNLQVLQVPQAQRLTRGAGVRVAIVDTGVDATHPDLSGRVKVQRNFVDRAKPRHTQERHGTAVAGVIAALDNNGQGIVGIAPAAQLLSLRACWPLQPNDAKAVCNTFTLAQALAAAIDLRADVVNLSLGGPVDPLLDRLIAAGIQRGIVYVGATMPNAQAAFPVSTPGVIAVVSAESGASTASPTKSLYAPGANVLTLTPAGGYDFMSGSSLAAASVSAGIALLLAHRRGAERDHLYKVLAASGTAKSIDLCAALTALDGRAQCAHD